MSMARAVSSDGCDWQPTPQVIEQCQRLAEDLSVDCITRLRQITADLRRTGDDCRAADDKTILTSLSVVMSDAFVKSLAGEIVRFCRAEPMDVCAETTSDTQRALHCDTSPPPPIKSGSRLRRSLTKRIPSFVRRRGDKKSAKKEAVLRQLVDVEGASMQWAKCRVLLKREPGGHMISFFSPPKAVKPRSGIFCFLINEVRPTTRLELPDCQNSFVIKGINGMEYVLDCNSSTERMSWINIIDNCAHQDTTRGLTAVQPSVVTAVRDSQVVSSDDECDKSTFRMRPPLENCREQESSDDCIQSSPLMVDLPAQNGQAISKELLQSSSAIVEELNSQPWFHGPLSRQEATMLVCQGGTEAHGTFLVRQSESRAGQLVLTFNNRGHSKHLRLQVLSDGTCRVQDWTFDNVYHVLDYFKMNPLPLESGDVDDVILMSYIVALTRDTIDRKRARRIKQVQTSQGSSDDHFSDASDCARKSNKLVVDMSGYNGDMTGYHSDTSSHRSPMKCSPVMARERQPRQAPTRPQSYILANGGLSHQAHSENNYVVS